MHNRLNWGLFSALPSLSQGGGDWVAGLIQIKANSASQESWSWGLAELVVVIVIVDVVVYVLAVVLIIIAVHIMFGCDQ